MARRFAFLTMILCLLTTLFVLLRRKRIPGAATGPSWRLLGVVFGTIFFMMFNPTKWTHHFGAYAGIAGSLAALTAVAVSASALRSRRNRTIFLAGLLLMLALTFAGINGYWYVSSYGVPWFDKTVSIGGRQSNTFFLVLFALAVALAAWQYLREGFAAPPARANTEKGRRIRKVRGRPAHRHRRHHGAVRGPLAAQGRRLPVPGVLAGTLELRLRSPGETCGLAEDVLVEGDPNGGNLTRINRSRAAAGEPRPTRSAAADPVGFSPNGVPSDLTADYVEVKPGHGQHRQPERRAQLRDRSERRHRRRHRRDVGVNGSTAKLPFGLDPGTTPVLGSYQDGVQEPASLSSSWYAAARRAATTPR